MADACEWEAAMANTTPRYRGRDRTAAPTEESAPESRPLDPEELATRKWMLVTGGVGLLALVIAAISMVTLGRGSSSSETPAGLNVSAAATEAASGAGVSNATVPTAAAASQDASKLADAQATIAALQTQLQGAQDHSSDLERQLAANQQALKITTNRAETAEANVQAATAQQAELQSDLDAVNAELTEANADRAALTSQVNDAESRASAATARADESDAYAASLASTVDALHGCLDMHQQALYYTTLDAWGSVAAPMQAAAASCYQEVG
jgi:hypothetical protein